MTSFADKIAVVTGGGSGIGRALALALAREGARVVVADIDEADAAETVRLVAAAGSEGLAVRTNVADRPDVESLADRVFQRYGAVHVLCNNAGRGGPRRARSGDVGGLAVGPGGQPLGRRARPPGVLARA